MSKPGFSNALSRRIGWAFFLALVAWGALQARLYQLQISAYRPSEGNTTSAQTCKLVWQPDRGIVFDRNLREMVWNSEFQSLYATPRKVSNPATAAKQLAPIVEISAETLERRLSSKLVEVALKRRLSDAQVSAIKQLDLPGIIFRSEPSRNYIKGQLAGQIVGAVNIDNQGQFGIEFVEDLRLTGTPIWLEARRYGDRRAIFETDYTRDVPERGADVVLTIDETLQWIAERHLYPACEEYQAKSGAAVVMEPFSGEILAMASYPPFDPRLAGQYATDGEIGRSKHHAVTDLFEPGSTMKPLIVAIGLETGAITTETMIDCEGGRRYLPRAYRSTPIRDEHALKVASIADILVHSSNIGTGKIAEKIVGHGTPDQNNRILFDYLEKLGLIGKTGIELPGEASMVIRSWKNWNWNDLLVLAFGTGPVMTSSVGIAAAYCSLANGGRLVSPHLIKGYIGGRHRRFFEEHRPVGEQIFHPDNSSVVCEMLGEVVSRGTGRRAHSQWYPLGGKTGTAMKVVDGQYSREHRVLSFAGIAPVEDPRLVIVVLLNEPQGVRFGGKAAAPIFRAIAEESLAYLHIPPDCHTAPAQPQLGQHQVVKKVTKPTTSPNPVGIIDPLPELEMENSDHSGPLSRTEQRLSLALEKVARVLGSSEQ